MAGRQIVVEFLGDARNFKQTVAQVEGSSSSIGGKLKKFGLVAGAGFAAAGAAAVKFGADAIGNASDMNETLSKSQAIFGKQAPALERWASQAARSAGLSKQAALESAAGFGDMFSQIGFAGDQAAAMSKNVVQMSADLGSFNNLPTEDVAQRISAAFRGEYDSLQAVIPNINAARVQTEALNETGKKNAANLTAQEKAAAVLAIVHKDGARAMGDFARTSGGLANQQKILKAQFENVSASIGAKLLPIAVKVVSWFNDTALPVIQKFGGWISDHIPAAFEQISAVVKRVFGNLSGNVSGPLNNVKSIIQSTVSIVQSLWNRFGKTLVEFTRNSFKNIVPVIKGAFKVIAGIFKVFSSLLKGDWKGVWQGIKQILSGAFAVLKGMVKQALNVIKTLFKIGWSALKGVVSGAFGGIRSAVANGISNVVGLVRGLPSKIKGVGGAMLSAGKALIGKLFDGILSAARSAGGFVGDLVNSIKRAVNSALHLPLEINFDKGPLHIHATLIPAFPAYAKGTAFAVGGMALVGEEGPELVNLPRGSRVHTAAQTSRMVGGGTVINITVNGALDPVAVGRQVEQAVNKYRRSSGRPVLA